MKTYFERHELECPCCGECNMDKEFLSRLNHARDQADFPFVITSGYRCENRNAYVGSKSTNHTSGKAVDIRCHTLGRRYTIVAELVRAGIKGIGINKTFIHADINREWPVIWLY